MRQHITEAISTHKKMELSIVLENYAIPWLLQRFSMLLDGVKLISITNATIPHLLTFLMEFWKVSLFREQIVE